jgi:DNA-binding transcriptional MerR regulator
VDLFDIIGSITVQKGSQMPGSQIENEQVPLYRSGAAARLAGIPVETLRVWERRYKIVGPHLSPAGQRLYSVEDVSRLAVIKQLVDAGHAIGSIAALDLEPLRAMRDQASRATAAGHRGEDLRGKIANSAVRMAVVGQALVIRMERQRIPAVQVVASSPDATHALEAMRGLCADVLLIESPTLQRETAEVIRSLAQQLGARRVIVEYGFGPQRIEQELRALGYSLMRAPMELGELDTLCGLLPADTRTGPACGLAQLNPAPPRRFDSRALAEISMASVALHCECPHHLVDLLVRLGNFETYSGECVIRSPADAALHRYLQQVTAGARASLEAALARVAEEEGIPLPTSGLPVRHTLPGG